MINDFDCGCVLYVEFIKQDKPEHVFLAERLDPVSSKFKCNPGSVRETFLILCDESRIEDHDANLRREA